MIKAPLIERDLIKYFKVSLIDQMKVGPAIDSNPKTMTTLTHNALDGTSYLKKGRSM